MLNESRTWQLLNSSKNCLVHFIKCYKLLWRNNSYIFFRKDHSFDLFNDWQCHLYIEFSLKTQWNPKKVLHIFQMRTVLIRNECNVPKQHSIVLHVGMSWKSHYIQRCIQTIFSQASYIEIYWFLWRWPLISPFRVYMRDILQICKVALIII